MTQPPHTKSGIHRIQALPERVYLDFYRLTEAPFTITPDPEFLFSSSCHRQVLDKIAYAIDGRMGFVLLTGEVGTGKTTVCRTLLDSLSDRAETVYVINPSLSGRELLAEILEDTGVPPMPGASKKNLINRFHQRLLEGDANRPLVVVIDDAQTMTTEALEDLRLLSNLETDKHKLIQVVLSGQPELLNLLADQRLRQLKQRIAIHCRLGPLSNRETDGYISRRLFVAGNIGQVEFSHSATRMIHRTSGGIPRLINKICDFSLTAGYVADATSIATAHVRRALAELDDLDLPTQRPKARLLSRGLAAAVLAAGLAGALFFSFDQTAVDSQDGILTGHGGVVSRAWSASTPEPIAASPSGKDPSGPQSPDTDSLPTAENRPQPIPADKRVHLQHTGLPADAADLPPLVSPAPYAIQLGSFRTIEQARRSVENYRLKGIRAHWQKVGDGQWVRVAAGKFEGIQEARQYQSRYTLRESLIINAPLTVHVLARDPDRTAAEVRRLLSKLGYDSLMEAGQTGDNEIHTGLFVSMADAAATADRITGSGYLLAQAVSR